MTDTNGSFVDENITLLGSNYTYIIVPFNGRYQGPEYNKTLFVYGPPSPPVVTDEDIDVWGGNISVAWNESLEDGGLEIAGYEVYLRQNGTQWRHSGTHGTDNMSRAWPDLHNGVEYQFMIIAFHSKGEGIPYISDWLTPFGIPGPPKDLSLENIGRDIELDWKKPDFMNGSTVTKYRVYVATDWYEITRGSYYDETEDTYYTYTGPELDTKYYFRISAVNKAGEGPWSNWNASRVIVLPPTVPRNLNVTNTTTHHILLTWDAPIDFGGPDLLYYHVFKGTRSGELVFYWNVTNVTRFEDEDAVGDTDYFYQVMAVNYMRDGPMTPEKTIHFNRAPGVVQNLTVVQVGETMRVEWDEPEETSGVPTTLYDIERVDDYGGDAGDQENTEHHDDDHPLDPGERYRYRVRALNDYGWGLWSDYVAIVAEGHIGQPIDFKVEPGDKLYSLTWKPPSEEVYYRVDGYHVLRGESILHLTLLKDVGDVTSFEDEGVEYNTVYFYIVVAYDVHKGSKVFGNNSSIEEPPPLEEAPIDPIPDIAVILAIIVVVILVILSAVLVVSRGRKEEMPEEKQVEEEVEVTVLALEEEPETPVPPWETAAPVKAALVTEEVVPAAPDGILPYIVEEVFVVYKDGRLITSCAREECGTADADLMSGMLIAIQGLIQDGLESGGTLEQIKYGENLISLATGEHLVLAAVVYGRPDEEFQEELRGTVSNIEGNYTGVIEDWTGEAAALEGLDELVMPLINRTTYLTREDVGDVLADHGVALLSAIDFHRGYVRLKMAAVNATLDTIIDSAVEIHYDGDMLRLERVEPDTVIIRGDRINLGNILPGERKTVALLFDPQICQSTHLDGHLSYYDSKGELRYVEMKRRTADVVCPVFFTRENANTAMLRRLMKETLHMNDLRIYRYPKMLTAQEVLVIAKQALGSDEVQLVREYITKTPTYEAEVWYYAETRIKGYQFVIRLGVVEDKGVVELFAASTAMEPITGLLADFRRELNRILEERYEEDSRMEILRDEKIRRDLERRPLRLDSADDVNV